MDQGFPVLENVPPIPLIIKDLGAVVFVAQVDRKPIPRTAGITVAPAEFQGQILCGQSLEIEVIVLFRLFLKEGQIEFFGPSGHHVRFLEEYFMVRAVDVRHEVLAFNRIIFIKNSAAHHVEHGVGEMPDVAATIGRELQSIAARNERHEAFGPLLNVLQQFALQGLGRLKLLFQANDFANGLAQIRNDHPVFASVGC